MNIYAITAPLNAFITCAFIMLFMSKIKLKPEIKCPIIYLVYAVFVLGSLQTKEKSQAERKQVGKS